MSPHRHVRDHFLPPDPDAYRRKEPSTGRVIVIAPTRAACETIEKALAVNIETLLEREHGADIRRLAAGGDGFGIVAATGTGKTLAIRPIAESIVGERLKVGVVNREREATPETATWNVVIVTTGIARRWFQDELIDSCDTIVADEIHQTSAELELCLALGKHVGCRFVWLSATVDPKFYATYLRSAEVLETTAFDPARAAQVESRRELPREYFRGGVMRRIIAEKRGVAAFLPTRAEVEQLASEVGDRWGGLETAFYHGGEPIRVILPFLEGEITKPFLLAMTAAGQSALNVPGLDMVVIYDSRFSNVVDNGRNVLTRQYLGSNEILQMAGRVHGRVKGGKVVLLTERDIDFDSLLPTAPEFQLAGDSERVALTAAALGVNLEDLDLPVPLDPTAYRRAVSGLTERNIIEAGRLTDYGKDVEAMPVDRPWAELLVTMDDELLPYVAVCANIDSLHRMTREEADLHDLIVTGSDHLTAYNVYAEAMREAGYLGRVYGLPRHQFREEIEEWAERRGVLVKAIEDVALGMASVYRTLEVALPAALPSVTNSVHQKFAELIAWIMPFSLVIDGEQADGRRVKLARDSVCNRWGAIAGSIRYFAAKDGSLRAAIEGTNIPLKLIRRYARREAPEVEYRARAKKSPLSVTHKIVYFGFELERQRESLLGEFPPELANSAVAALARALVAGLTPHPNGGSILGSVKRSGEYWRRSGGKLEGSSPAAIADAIQEQLSGINSWDDFLKSKVRIDEDSLLESTERAYLDALPATARVGGWAVPIEYDVENGVGIARLVFKQPQLSRLRAKDIPSLDRPLRFKVLRGSRKAILGRTLAEVRSKLRAERPRRSRNRRSGWR